jgi:hypothetical protein
MKEGLEHNEDSRCRVKVKWNQNKTQYIRQIVKNLHIYIYINGKFSVPYRELYNAQIYEIYADQSGLAV